MPSFTTRTQLPNPVLPEHMGFACHLRLSGACAIAITARDFLCPLLLSAATTLKLCAEKAINAFHSLLSADPFHPTRGKAHEHFSSRQQAHAYRLLNLEFDILTDASFQGKQPLTCIVLILET